MYNDERKIFKNILSYTKEKTKNTFEMSKNGDIYIFKEKTNPNNYVTVRADLKEHDWLAPVNADFKFQKPAGSNNYPELIKVGEKLLKDFDIL